MQMRARRVTLASALGPAFSRPPDPADPVLEQLRRSMASLEKRYSAATPAAP